MSKIKEAHGQRGKMLAKSIRNVLPDWQTRHFMLIPVIYFKSGHGVRKHFESCRIVTGEVMDRGADSSNADS